MNEQSQVIEAITPREIKIEVPSHLKDEYKSSATRILYRWGNRNPGARPDYVLVPERSGPLTTAKLLEFASKNDISLPPFLNLANIGNKLIGHFERDMVARGKENSLLSPGHLGEDLSEEYQRLFWDWISEPGNDSTQASIGTLRSLSIPKPHFAICDDARGKGKSPISIIPGLLQAAFGKDSFTYSAQNDIEYLFPKSPDWLDQIIKNSFKHPLDQAETRFLAEIAKGEYNKAGLVLLGQNIQKEIQGVSFDGIVSDPSVSLYMHYGNNLLTIHDQMLGQFEQILID